MMDLQSYLAIALSFFAVALSPGPANIANAVIGMSLGRRASFVFSLGLTAGSLCPAPALDRRRGRLSVRRRRDRSDPLGAVKMTAVRRSAGQRS